MAVIQHIFLLFTLAVNLSLVKVQADDNTCTCAHGTPFPAKYCENNPFQTHLNGRTELCTSCNFGYRLLKNHTCSENVCSCPNGIALKGGKCPHNGKPGCFLCGLDFKNIDNKYCVSDSGDAACFRVAQKTNHVLNFLINSNPQCFETGRHGIFTVECDINRCINYCEKYNVVQKRLTTEAKKLFPGINTEIIGHYHCNVTDCAKDTYEFNEALNTLLANDPDNCILPESCRCREAEYTTQRAETTTHWRDGGSGPTTPNSGPTTTTRKPITTDWSTPTSFTKGDLTTPGRHQTTKKYTTRSPATTAPVDVCHGYCRHLAKWNLKLRYQILSTCPGISEQTNGQCGLLIPKSGSGRMAVWAPLFLLLAFV